MLTTHKLGNPGVIGILGGDENDKKEKLWTIADPGMGGWSPSPLSPPPTLFGCTAQA